MMDENIQADIAYANALNSGLMGLSEMTNPLQNIQKPTAPTQLTISDQKKAELQKLAEKDQRKRNRRAYWYLSKEEMADAQPDLAQTSIGTLPRMITGLFNNDYSNALASFSANAINPIKDVFEETNNLISQMNLKKTVPGNGIPSGESQLAKQGMKIEYMNLFK